MPKRKRHVTEAKIQQWLKEGRGLGTGADYQPLLNIQDVASRGNVHRYPGKLTGRVHQTLSNLEQDYLYGLELAHFAYGRQVVDIREQYPLLPVAMTESLAEKLGVAHPTDPKTRVSIPMTTDFVVTMRRGYDESLLARTVKPAKHLSKPRVLEKFDIERAYWAERGVDWGIVTERDLPKAYVQNARDLLPCVDLKAYDIQAETRQHVAEMLHMRLSQANLPLMDVCASVDQQTGFAPGTALTVAKHLIVTGQWAVDLRVRFDPGKPLVFREVRP